MVTGHIYTIQFPAEAIVAPAGGVVLGPHPPAEAQSPVGKMACNGAEGMYGRSETSQCPPRLPGQGRRLRGDGSSTRKGGPDSSGIQVRPRPTAFGMSPERSGVGGFIIVCPG